MNAAVPSRPLRQGQTQKRSAIMAAARELFVQDGVDRTSMDAVAARAGVSKRTVYDYYGDKRGLLLGVVLDAGESLVASLRTALDTHLSDTAEIDDTAALERAFTGFAIEIGSSMFGSSDYATTVKLISENHSLLPELEQHPLNSAPEEALAERIAHFAGTGLLDVEDPRLASDHFNALTTLLAWNNWIPGEPARGDVQKVMTSGVHAFMRAYGAR